MADGTLDFSSFAPALSPGQAGVGGFVAPTVDDPATSASQTGNAFGFANSTLGQNLPGWLGGSFTPAAGSSLQGALSTLSKGTGGGAGAADAKVPGPLNVQNAQGAQGAGASRGSSETLGTLLAALDARRNLLLQSAVSGQARPVANMANPAAGGATRQTTGLLGI